MCRHGLGDRGYAGAQTDADALKNAGKNKCPLADEQIFQRKEGQQRSLYRSCDDHSQDA